MNSLLNLINAHSKRMAIALMLILGLAWTPGHTQLIYNTVQSYQVNSDIFTTPGNSSVFVIPPGVGTFAGIWTGVVGIQPVTFFCFDLGNEIRPPIVGQSVLVTAPNNPILQGIPLGSPPNLASTSLIQGTASLLKAVSLGGGAGLGTPDQNAGLQLAIWHILGGTFSGGTTGALAAYAADLAIFPDVAAANDWYGVALFPVLALDGSGFLSEQVLGAFDPGLGAPEPGTYLALGSFLLIGAMCYKRQTFKQSI